MYEKGEYIGDTSMAQVTAGFQFGGQAFSQIIFFEDKRALDEFTTGNFEFSAEASAVAITAAADAQATSTGNSAGVSAGKNDAKEVGGYRKSFAGCAGRAGFIGICGRFDDRRGRRRSRHGWRRPHSRP